MLLLALGAAAPAPSGGSLSDRYDRARKTLEENRAHESETRVERDRLALEAKTLQDKLIANAARVQELESAFAVTQDELVRLRAAERDTEAGFVRDRVKVGHLLAVLQRLDSDEPPALALRPDDSLAAARGAMLLGAMLPPVYNQAASLAVRLKTLTATRAELEKKDREAHLQAEALNTARRELDGLLAVRSREAGAAEVKLNEIHGITEEVGREAQDLKTLIDRIAALRAQPGDSGMIFVGPGKEAAALRRGSLRQPVIGRMMAGDPAGPGVTPGTGGPEGLWFEGSGNAQVVAPGDSEVVFAGTYQKFGQVLILEITGGYHLTLAGFGRIDVHIGDLVLAGEPLGVLPDGKMARLYLELRRNGQTVNPAQWMSAELRKAKGT